jgi:hypothetical protein
LAAVTEGLLEAFGVLHARFETFECAGFFFAFCVTIGSSGPNDTSCAQPPARAAGPGARPGTIEQPLDFP